jgi:hypothetical protein
MHDTSVIQAEFGDLGRYAQCPDFWLAKPDKAMLFIRKLKEGRVRRIGKTAGGREILAIEYGKKEPLDATCDNLMSAVASKVVPPDPTDIFPPAFFGSQRRRRPVLALQGAIHGGELTGTVASLNLCQVIETGRDLRGKAWPRLQYLAKDTHLVIIPWLNADGVERWPLPNPSGAPAALCERCSQGVAADGTRLKHPEVKGLWPVPVERTAYLGSYFNDAGINLQYDFCMPRRQPETLAWMECYLAERPDGVLIWHCNAGSMMGPPPMFLPEGYKHQLDRLAGAVRQRLLRDGYEIGRLSWAGLPGLGKPGFDQITAAYFCCGALPILCELPMGCEPACFSCEQMLDIGLITIEETLFYAHRDGLRPYELWDKVKKQFASR